MQTTETRTDLVTMARAETLARVLHGQTADGDAPPAIKQAKRVAQAVRTDRQRAILWSHQALNHEAVTWEILIVLGVDQLVADAADNLGRRHRESVRDYAKRIAACDDTDVLAVAVALIDNQIEEGVEQQDDTLAAYKKARRVLKRAAALANQQPGATSPAGEVADDRPTEPALRTAVMTLMEHSEGAENAMSRIMQLLHHQGESWQISGNDMQLVLGNVHDVMLVVALLFIEMTAERYEKTSAEDRRRLFKTKTIREGMEMSVRTIAHRLRGFSEAHGGEEPRPRTTSTRQRPR